LAGGLLYERDFVAPAERAEVVAWLAALRPLEEQRYTARAVAAGAVQRRLLRPVYWLGGWQFACLDYYRPPEGIADRCVRAEPFPPALARLVARAERLAHARLPAADVPRDWRLNTCLVNLYGDRAEGGRSTDTARLGEHKDFEPGPVASISLGERALFEFVRPGRADAPARVVERRWLEDGSLLLFAGDEWKRRTLHRVLRVERRRGERFPVAVPGFETRRVNFTFRFVPDAHLVPFAGLSRAARDDVRGYVEELARASAFWREALRAERS
jgi:alkylated DNA repair dioxygenase AlkB